MVPSSPVLRELAVVAHLVAPAASSTVTASGVESDAMAAAEWFVDVAVVPRERMLGAVEAELRGCGADNRCLAARLDQHGIPEALYVVVNPSAGVVTSELVVAGISELTPIEHGVERAIADSVRRTLTSAGHRLGARVTVEVVPPEAIVRSSAGITNGVPKVVPPGRIEIEASLAGYATERRELDAAAGSEQTLRIELEQESVLASWWLWTIIGTAAATAIAVPLGIALSAPTHEFCHASLPCE